MKMLLILLCFCFGYGYCAIPRRQPSLFQLLRRHELWPRPATESSMSNYIIGGYTADIANFPYQLSLRKGNDHMCGASAISSYWALTAGHCLDDGTMPSWISFRSGSPHRLVGGYISRATQYHLHPNYDPNTLDFDVAVVLVKEPFFGNNFTPIQLVKSEQAIASDTIATVTGWGLSDDHHVPYILQALDLLTNSKSECDRAWIEQISDKMFCAGGVIGQDTCNGDSGGPLVANGIQIGIVSWGRIECASDAPGVYTNISNPDIRLFIKSKTGI